MSDTPLLLKENLLRDVEELVRELDQPFTDADMTSNDYGLDLSAAAEYFTEAYNGTIDFMISMKAKLLIHKRLTPAQGRAVLNIMRQGIRGEAPAPAKERDQAVACFTCKAEFPDMQKLLDHKAQAHGRGGPKLEIAPDGGEFAPTSVIANTTSALKLDLSGLPDGRYAAPNLDPTKSANYVFLMVRRQRKRVFRNKRYVWGKIETGKEWVEAGTIEVKEWSSDSKRLCGEQKPGDVYRGEFELQLRAILAAPEPWAKLFGTEIGSCGICGKTLTDDISRSDGFGPECIKKINEHYFTRKIETRFTREYDANFGRERVWCLEHKVWECEERHNFFDLDDEV